ncbi:MAG: S41 family peptidase [Candidatus Moranbacteria bacterium]|nr:S41 family peptidase [Candidatus Moranbacteria bacterium]
MENLSPTPSEQNNESEELVLASEYERGYRLFKKAFAFFFVLFLIGAAFWSGYEQGKRFSPISDSGVENTLSPDEAIFLNKTNQDKTIDFSLFWKVWGLLKSKYVDNQKLDAHALFYGAIKGMLAATGDPYTTFFDPKENAAFQEDISGTFEGIGAEMGVQNEVLTVIAPLEGTPAEKAGLLAGDKIIKIDDQATSSMSLDEAVGKIRGAKGSEVKLTLFHNGDEESSDIVVKRDVILVKSVRFEMKENTIAYIRISRFGDDTNKEFQEAVKQTVDKKAKGLIIDMRNDPGGFLETAVDIASVMLPSGKVVVMEENGAGERKEIKSRGGDVLSQIPTVVLINEGSASASEILAGALKDNRDNVTLVGKKSFGKGSVQELTSVSKDTAVKITVARWLTPAGNQINTVGIAPDIEVNITREDIDNKRDPQLDKALEILKGK